MGVLQYTTTTPTPLHDHWFARLRLRQRPANPPEAAAIPVVIPHAKGFANPAERALRQEGLNPVTVPLADDHAYGRLLTEAWRRGGFVLVEADVVPWPGAVRMLWECPEALCVHEYPHGKGDLAPALGCVRFSDELVAACPDLPERWEGQPWDALDGLMLGGIWEATGRAWHIHEPPVAHARQRTD